jgi:regulator of nucleoside diphosphate kinase
VNPRNIIVSRNDLHQLRSLLRVQSNSALDQDHLVELQDEIDRATILDEHEIPGDIITINAQITVRDLATSDERTYTLVLPSQADLTAGRVSILAPLGTALLGFREGDEIEWNMPGGTRKLRIVAVKRALEEDVAAS